MTSLSLSNVSHKPDHVLLSAWSHVCSRENSLISWNKLQIIIMLSTTDLDVHVEQFHQLLDYKNATGVAMTDRKHIMYEVIRVLRTSFFIGLINY